MTPPHLANKLRNKEINEQIQSRNTRQAGFEPRTPGEGQTQKNTQLKRILPNAVVRYYKIQVNPIHTILKYGDYYDFMDR